MVIDETVEYSKRDIMPFVIGVLLLFIFFLCVHSVELREAAANVNYAVGHGIGRSDVLKEREIKAKEESKLKTTEEAETTDNSEKLEVAINEVLNDMFDMINVSLPVSLSICLVIVGIRLVFGILRRKFE